MKWEKCSFDTLAGQTLKTIKREVGQDGDEDEDEDRIVFETETGDRYFMQHRRDCCEVVYIKEIVGELDNLIGSPLLFAYESTNEGDESSLSFTWTFYNLATVKGAVTITWYGESNGYYSEAVGLYLMKGEENE